MLYGMDGSHYADGLLWADVMSHGYGNPAAPKIPEWAVWKASEGLWVWDDRGRRRMWHDDTYEEYIRLIQRSGIPDGSYHYYREPIDRYIPDAETQAREFYGFVSSFPSNQMPPCLDVEIIGNPYVTSRNVWTCLYHLKKLFNRVPIIYTGYYVWRDYLRGPDWGMDYPLWIASYRSRPLIPLPWKQPTIWQYSDRYGDENYFMGDQNALDRLCSGKDFQIQIPIDVSVGTKPTIKETYTAVKGYFKKNGKYIIGRKRG